MPVGTRKVEHPADARSCVGRFRATVPEACRKIADSNLFQGAIFVVIVANTLVLGLETYGGIDREAGDTLNLLNDVFLGVFVVEMAIRITAHAPRPQDFFRDGWNVFDFSTVAAAFVPGVRENATLLRLVRLLRVVRIVSVLPDLRVLVRGMVRSVPPIASIGLLAVVLIYIYGMLGWLLFGDDLPNRWGNIGEAMLTLFTVLTLEGWNDVLYQAQEVNPQAWIFFVSFVLLASFLLINIVIAIVINSIEEARESEREALIEAERAEAERSGVTVDEDLEVEARVLALRKALEDLERELAIRDHLEDEKKPRLRARARHGRA